MKNIFYIMGKSSTGKDTIFNMLKNDKELNLKNIVPWTTRPMRNGEVHGREYFFVDEEKLNELTKMNKVIECRSYNTIKGIWHYFTVINDSLDLTNYNYLLTGTLENYKKITNYFDINFEKSIVVPIYIYVQNEERLLRAIRRETNGNFAYNEMLRRFMYDEIDFSQENIKKNEINNIYENNQLNLCYKNIKDDIIKYIKRSSENDGNK